MGLELVCIGVVLRSHGLIEVLDHSFVSQLQNLVTESRVVKKVLKVYFELQFLSGNGTRLKTIGVCLFVKNFPSSFSTNLQKSN